MRRKFLVGWYDVIEDNVETAEVILNDGEIANQKTFAPKINDLLDHSEGHECGEYSIRYWSQIETVEPLTKVEYFVTAKGRMWERRYPSGFRNECGKWEKLKNDKWNKIEDVLRTHKYNFDTYPDNDSFHTVVEYDVEIKRVVTEMV